MSALTGVRVVELGDAVSAPFCARLLADFGAEVIKLERAPHGDVARHWGPFPGGRPDSEASGLFFFCNTGKRSVLVDLGTAEGIATVRRLLATADVFVENQHPADMRAWGLDHASLAADLPDLVMTSITPFGQTGPCSSWRAHDLNAFHFSATGNRYCGARDDAPLQHGTFSADFFGGYVAATWTLAALFGREVVGGQHLDVATSEVVAALFTGAQNIGSYAQEGRFDRRSGSGMSFAAPARILPCADGFVWMIALEAAQWDGLCTAMGDPDWATIELFRNLLERGRNSDFIYEMLEQWTMSLTKQEVMDLCQANGCPTTAIYTIEELANHPHLAARGQLVTIDHPVLGPTTVFGAPIRLPDCPGGPAGPAPLLGQHTDEVTG